MKNKFILFTCLILSSIQLFGAQHKSVQEIASSKAMQGFAAASAAIKARALKVHDENAACVLAHPTGTQQSLSGAPESRVEPFAGLRERYKTQFARKESELMIDFFKLTDISLNEWHKRYSESFEAYHALEQEKVAEIKGRFDHPLDKKLQQKIVQLCAECSIDARPIAIIRDDMYASICGMMRNLFIVNQTILDIPSTILESIILHELMHLSFNDPYISFCMARFLIDKNIAQNKANAFIRKWRLFCEQRADVMAALYSAEHAQAAIVFFSQSKQIGYEGYHPTHKERAHYLTKVLNEMITMSKHSQSITK